MMRLLLTLCLLGLPLRGADWFVSPEATTSDAGSGTLASPGSLLTACSHTGWAGSISAGDTIWLRGGTYRCPNPFQATNYWEWVVQFDGATNNPVTWRSASNEWAVVSGCWDFGYSHFHRFRDMEFYDPNKSYHIRWTPDGVYVRQGAPWGHFATSGFAGDYQEFINCIIHDVRLVWGAGSGWRVRGCILWNIGQNSLEHVEYNASKYFMGNAVGWTAGSIINFTGENHSLINSNIMFGAYDAFCRTENTDSTLVGNRFYPTHLTGTVKLIDARNGSYTITNNTLIGDGWPIIIKDNPYLNFSGNTVMVYDITQGWPILENQGANPNGWVFDYNGYYARSPRHPIFRDAVPGYPEVNTNFSGWRSTYPTLDVHSSAPDGLPPDSAHVIPNFDQPKRAHIAVYNWSLQENVSVNVSGVLMPGDPYRLWSIQDFNHGPILTGVLSGTTITIPMTNLSIAPIPYGTNNTPHNAMNPEFGAFLLIGPNAPANPYPSGSSISDTNPPVNHAPVAVSDSYSVNQDATLIVDAGGVLANDTDADGNSLFAMLDTGVSHGTLSLSSSGGFTYTPFPSYSGSDSFTYHASDGTARSPTVTVTIMVNAIE